MIGQSAAHSPSRSPIRTGPMIANRKEDWLMYLGFGGAFMLLVALLGFALHTVSRLAGALERNVDTYSAINAAANARISVELVRAGYGGFMLTQADEGLELMEEGERGLESALDSLSAWTLDDPVQNQRVQRAREINNEWRLEYRDPSIETVRRMPAATALIYGRAIVEAEGRRFQTYTSELYDLLSGITRHEEAQLVRRTSSLQGLKLAASWLIALGGLIGVFAAAAFAFLGIVRSRALVNANRSLHMEVEERQRAEVALARASQRNAMILEAAGEGICGLDAMGRIIFINPAASEMLGVKQDEVMLRPGASVLYRLGESDPDGEQEALPVYGSLRDGSVHHAPLDSFRRADGSTFPVEYITRPIFEDGEVTGCVLTFKDISERRAVEKLKDEFVSVVSHELRTPLTSIRGSLGLLASGMLGTLHERGQRMLEIAAQNTDRLVRLINDILDIERIESGAVTMKPERVEAGTLIEQSVESVLGTAEKSGIRLEVLPGSATIWADPDRIVQVLTNLLSNAIKFSEEGSSVSVSAAEEEGMLHFTVTDRGRGIPKSQLSLIFDRFQQVDASDSREKGGTGLGLAIARSIVLQHGGDIWVESEVGEGSRFHFTVPLQEASHLPAKKDGGPTVLLCDDDEVTLEVVGDQLREQGYTVVAVSSGEAAVEAARIDPPDAILLDLAMPGMDGWETMVALRSQETTRSVPIIIFSGTPQIPHPLLEDVDEWVVKSTGAESLFRAMERALHRGARIGRILLVEDDIDLAEVLIAMFETHGVEAVHADSYADAVRLARQHPPDLLVMDIVLREGDAYELVDSLRRDDQMRAVPLVVYSALDLDDAQRDRLKLGPTQFMTKGRVSPGEFERRIVSLMDEIFLGEGAAA